MLSLLAVLQQGLRTALLAGGVLLALVAALDWAVRTRRLNPFGAIARTLRSHVDPRLAGVERVVVRSGGHPSSTPWWALGIYLLFGLLLIALVDLVRGLVIDVMVATSNGAGGLVWLVIDWTFGLLILALMLRVLGSWIPPLARGRLGAWSYRATEWMLRPLRRALPAFGPLDISPIVAYFALTLVRWLLETVLKGGGVR